MTKMIWHERSYFVDNAWTVKKSSRHARYVWICVYVICEERFYCLSTFFTILLFAILQFSCFVFGFCEIRSQPNAYSQYSSLDSSCVAVVVCILLFISVNFISPWPHFIFLSMGMLFWFFFFFFFDEVIFASGRSSQCLDFNTMLLRLRFFCSFLLILIPIYCFHCIFPHFISNNKKKTPIVLSLGHTLFIVRATMMHSSSCGGGSG